MPEIEEFYQLVLPSLSLLKIKIFIGKSQLEIIKGKQGYSMFKNHCKKET